jgi:hypothetical protein
MHTTHTLVPQPGSFKVEIAVKKFKRYKEYSLLGHKARQF